MLTPEWLAVEVKEFVMGAVTLISANEPESSWKGGFGEREVREGCCIVPLILPSPPSVAVRDVEFVAVEVLPTTWRLRPGRLTTKY